MNAGVPAGYPFFGNQHTDGGYDGGYKYDAMIIERDADSLSKLASEASAISLSSISAPVNTITPLSQDNAVAVQGENDPLAALIISGVLAAVGGLTALGVYVANRSKQKKKLKEVAETRTCDQCNKSLSGGAPFLPRKKDMNAYIECPHCKHKNIVLGFDRDD